MKTLDLSIGKKKYSLKCREDDTKKIKSLSDTLNRMVNKNSFKYKGLSPDNLILITILEILSQKPATQIEKQDASSGTPTSSITSSHTNHINKTISQYEPLHYQLNLVPQLQSILRCIQEMQETIPNTPE